jgi:hypothetical protein
LTRAEAAAAAVAAGVLASLDGKPPPPLRPPLPPAEVPPAAMPPAAADSSVAPAAAAPLFLVFTDLPQVRASLRRAEFAFVDARDQATLIWTGEHIRDFDTLRGRSRPLLNQFPHESILIAKNLFGECAQRRYGRGQPWLADTYTLPHELPDLVHRWQPAGAAPAVPAAPAAPAGAPAPTMPPSPRRYILKPWNMSRSRGIVIVDEVEAALALCDTALGPRLACAYVEHPLLLDGYKFDCRMYVGVRSLSPPRLYLYKHWYARVCSQPYAGAPPSDHLAHVTVQKYLGVQQQFVLGDALVARLSAATNANASSTGEFTGERSDASCGRHGGRFEWEACVKPRLLSALADTFRLLLESGEGGGEWGGGRCRALYGVDVLFADSRGWQESGAAAEAAAPTDGAQPVVLEVNYSPDFGKLLELHPSFLNDAFAKLFLDEEAGGEEAWDTLPL